ncbi:two-component system, chemotaxis family, response regulator CheB [Selenomonas sp. GACV-9]|uniref:chemotaxis protein CheB n=1 Tax=Selenomonas sp. GACV-9 TaxID=3158782 RepID=UPI0008EDCE14|nr:two-component system, chemotaxis family, response regulator CheB [Selenomonas ruminantium]
MAMIRVLVMEPSAMARDTVLAEIRKRFQDVTLAGVSEIDEAILKIRLFRPDVIVLNLFMGIQQTDNQMFLSIIVHMTHAPVVSYGMLAKTRSCAESMGAFSYLAKPKADEDKTAFFDELALSIAKAYEQKVASRPGGASQVAELKKTFPAAPQTQAKPAAVPAVKRKKPVIVPVEQPAIRHTNVPIRIIAIGSSTGGTKALSDILPQLRPPLPPIVIAQHIPPVFSERLAERLDNECHLTVKEGADGDIVRSNTVYIAPGHKHMTVKRIDGGFQLVCQPGRPVHGVCPSADVLFHSVAQTAGDTALGVILTGMGRDGAEGLLDMLRCGARTIGQDKQSSVVYGMPKAAFDIGAVELQIPLEKMARTIQDYCRNDGR